ncbi:MAG: hypothetical protein HXS41_00670 [Theionarchaea archaeon]|nr:hypothetical protein [Theionarchaea archaeon]MBU7019544.1 hypothetical protein [Theionarchaea archaeon]
MKINFHFIYILIPFGDKYPLPSGRTLRINLATDTVVVFFLKSALHDTQKRPAKSIFTAILYQEGSSGESSQTLNPAFPDIYICRNACSVTPQAYEVHFIFHAWNWKKNLNFLFFALQISKK